MASPANSVWGIVDEGVAAGRAVTDLKAAGFWADGLSGENGASRIETVEWPGGLLLLLRRVMRLSIPDWARYARAARAGHHVIWVTGVRGRHARQQACTNLRLHGGHFINACGAWSFDALAP